MKKFMLAAAVAVAVLLSGCSQATSNIETVRSDALDITAKAFPGLNYVTWSYPVDGSDWVVLRDDGTYIADSQSTGYYYVDTEVQDNVKYTYTVYTLPANAGEIKFQFTNSSTIYDIDTLEGYVAVGNSASDSCTAINPACIKDGKLMTALELCEYEPGCNEDFVINEENIVVELVDDSVVVAFPTKSYLTYTAKLYKGNSIELFGRDKVDSADINDVQAGEDVNTSVDSNNKQTFYTNDGTYRWNSTVTNAGEYTVEVAVDGWDTSKYSTSYVKAAKKVTIDALDTTVPTDIKAAGYIDEGNTIRLIWSPAEKVNEAKYGIDSYKVYLKDSKSVYTEISPAKVARVDDEGEEVIDEETDEVIYDATLVAKSDFQAGEEVYYIDYAVADNKVGYNFVVVLSENGKYEVTAAASAVAKYEGLSKLTAATNAINTSLTDIMAGANIVATYGASMEDLEDVRTAGVLTNDAVLTFNVADDKFAIKDVKYKTVNPTENHKKLTAKDLILDSEMTEVASIPVAYNTEKVIVKNVALDSKVVFLVTVSYEGYEDYVFVAETAEATSAAASTVLWDFVDLEKKDAKSATTVKVEVTTGDYTANSKVGVEIAYAKLAEGASVASVTSWKVVPVTIAYDSTATVFTGKTAAVTLDPTTVVSVTADKGDVDGYEDTFVFRVTTTNKADPSKKKVEYKYQTVTKAK